MRNIILAAAAALALIVGSAPSFAGGNDYAKCAAITANAVGSQASDLEFCRSNY